jgi:glucan phosphoethanolaminetransferase (alkaline phosphatase superfamily)
MTQSQKNKYKPWIIGAIVILVLLLFVWKTDKNPKPVTWKNVIVPVALAALAVLFLLFFPWTWISFIVVGILIWAVWEIVYVFNNMVTDPAPVEGIDPLQNQMPGQTAPVYSVSQDPNVSGGEITDIV